MAEPMGLRERKKLRTHETIVTTAVNLFVEHGFQATTVADIAAAAEVAPSTVFSYFPTKEDILFAGYEPFLASFRERLEERSADTSALQAFRDWALEVIPPLTAAQTDEKRRLRQIIDSDERLQLQEKVRLARFEDVLTRETARDLDLPPDAPSVRIISGAVAGALGAILADVRTMSAAEREAQLRLAFAFAEGGLAAIAERGML